MKHTCSQCGAHHVPGSNYCPQCGKPKGGHSKQGQKSKREQFVETPEQKKRRMITYGLIAGGLLLTFVWITSNMPKAQNSAVSSQPVVTDAVSENGIRRQMVDIDAKTVRGKITIPLDGLKKNQFVAFSGGDNAVPLLAYVSNEGKVVTAVSMCEPCNSKRFHIQGNTLVCNTCGTTWDLNDLSPIRGGCAKYPPSILPNTVVKNSIEIDAQLVNNWKRRV